MAHPLTRGMSLDDPKTTELRRYVIREKSFLRLIYKEWYQKIHASLMPDQRPVLEIGSGGGFMAEFIPGLITSEVFYISSASLVLDALHMPLADNSLGVIVMINVPEISFNFWQSLEKALAPWMPYLGMFAQITLQKR